MALGKLSAGLAHELNNPSAAVIRSAQMLRKQLAELPIRLKNVINTEVTDEIVAEVNEILSAKIKSGIQRMSMMDKSDKEDELMDWLEDHGVEEADEITNNFVDYGFTEDDLEEIKDLLRKEDLPPVIQWINQVLTTERLVLEIGEAAHRINELVSSVKSYTHMDQAPEKQKADIHVGIENTLTMLNHKLKKGRVEVVKKFQEDMPEANILIGELNQVWTNLIDNAIDAMAESDVRTLTIRTEHKGIYANIYIEDSGSGIPDEIKDKVFDPFFTTKAVGQGTGIGLEMVHQIITQQHKGVINLTSRPGHTSFHICIPI
jgi:signal transduction histidine kinase